jgi:thioredoxin-like negative regulator of GroEL
MGVGARSAGEEEGRAEAGSSDEVGDGIGILESMVDFEREVVGSPLPVLLAFTAVWCAPCAWLDPYLLEAVREGKGRLRIFKVDVDRVPEAASRYRIGSVPIVILFRDGVEVERSVGVEPERIRALAGLR